MEPGTARVSPRQRVTPAVWLVAPACLFTLILLLWPLASTVLYSFYTYSAELIYLPVLTAANYLRFADSFYINVLWRTFRMALLATVFCALLGYPVAYFLARTRSRYRSLFLFLVVTPLMVGIVVRTYGWIILLSREGLVNRLLMVLGLRSEPVRFLGTEGAVVAGLIDVLLPLMILPLMSAIIKISPVQEEAATVLGARPWQTFFRVVLPLSVPGLLSGCLLVFSLSMGALATPMYLGGARNQTIATLIWGNMLTSFNWPFGSTLAVILMVATLVSVLGYLALLRQPGRGGRGVR